MTVSDSELDLNLGIDLRSLYRLEPPVVQLDIAVQVVGFTVVEAPSHVIHDQLLARPAEFVLENLDERLDLGVGRIRSVLVHLLLYDSSRPGSWDSPVDLFEFLGHGKSLIQTRLVVLHDVLLPCKAFVPVVLRLGEDIILFFERRHVTTTSLRVVVHYRVSS